MAGGFLAGALTAYYILWRSHALVPGHPLALRSAEIGVAPTARPVGVKTPTPISPRRDEPTPPPRDGRP